MHYTKNKKIHKMYKNRAQLRDEVIVTQLNKHIKLKKWLEKDARFK
jgi:hypothetical protein